MTGSKCKYGEPSKTLDREPRVLAYDSAGTDDGYRMVTLIRGFAFEDAAKNEGDDPETRMALHSMSFRTVKEAIDRVRLADPCKCGRCMN